MIYNLFICWSQNSLSRESVWVPTLLPSPPCCFEASSSIQKAALVLWCTTDSAGGVGPVFPGLTMPVISLQRAGGRLLCVTPPLCDTSAENVKGEQIPPSNLWGGWTLHPLAMTRGGWKSPLGLVHGDFLSTPPSIDVSALLLFSGFLTWYFYSLALQLLHALSLWNAVTVYSNVNENFLVAFISFLPPPHLLFPPLNPSFLPFLIAASPIWKDPITEAIVKALEDAKNKSAPFLTLLSKQPVHLSYIRHSRRGRYLPSAQGRGHRDSVTTEIKTAVAGVSSLSPFEKL